MMDLNNTRDLNRERILSQLNYNQSTPHSVDSATYSVSMPLVGTNFQHAETADIDTLLMNTLFKLVATLTTDSTYRGGGIGGTGHISDDVPPYDLADFIVINA